MHRLFTKKGKSSSKKSFELLACIYLFLIFLILLYHTKNIVLASKTIAPAKAEAKKAVVLSHITASTPSPTPERILTPVPTKIIPKPTAIQNDQWGIAKQVAEHTWTIKVGSDSEMGSAQDIFNALNSYRSQHGKGTLSWDEKLATYAQERAHGFSSAGKLDTHAGFNDYIHNQDGFHKLGFMGLGENSCLGYTLAGVKIIEWVFAGDAPHNDNQLNSSWSHVGIGVSGSAVNLIFGGSKM